MLFSPYDKNSSSRNDKEVKILQKQASGFQRSKTIVSYNTRHSISPSKFSNNAVFQNNENDEEELVSLLQNPPSIKQIE
jgi:hypothetical protein